MPHDLAVFITNYGYLAIFALVFLQEIGFPNPVPNELVLLFSGYLAYSGLLSFPLIFLTVVAADFIGTSLLYFVFYFLGEAILKKAPRWLPVHKIEGLKTKISEKGKWGIYLGRLVPYARGYVSVAAGLIGISPRVFLTTVILSAITWSGGYAVAGRVFGKEWAKIAATLGTQTMIIVLVVIILIVVLLPKIRRRIKNKQL